MLYTKSNSELYLSSYFYHIQTDRTSCTTFNNVIFSFQGVLLHSDGEVRAAGDQRGFEGGRRSPRGWRLRALQGAQPPLQQKQPH